MARRRAHGPYKHGQRWRVVTVGEDGARGRRAFDSVEEANDYIRFFEKAVDETEGVTVAQALDAYEVHMRQKGNRPRSIDTTRGRISRLLANDIDKPIRTVTETRCLKMYEALRSLMSVDYHRNALNESRTFFNWCAAKPRQWIRRNPVADIKGEGRRKRGKPQLTIDESRRFLAACSTAFADGDLAGAVGIAALHLGARISELVTRLVRDLDDDGGVLWISQSKTEAGKRKLEVPEQLRAILLQLAEGKQPHEPLFRGKRSGEHITRGTAHEMVKRMCARAGVPPIGPHGLRGTHATFARDNGVTPHVVAAAIGHKSYEAVTARNYVAPGTDERVQQRTVLRVLQGGTR